MSILILPLASLYFILFFLYPSNFVDIESIEKKFFLSFIICRDLLLNIHETVVIDIPLWRNYSCFH